MIKRIVTVFIIVFRVIIIGIILFNFSSNLNNGAPISLHLEVLRGTLLVYYLPYSVFSLFALWLLKNRKIFILFLFNISIIIFLDKIIRIFM